MTDNIFACIKLDFVSHDHQLTQTKNTRSNVKMRSLVEIFTQYSCYADRKAFVQIFLFFYKIKDYTMNTLFRHRNSTKSLKIQLVKQALHCLDSNRQICFLLITHCKMASPLINLYMGQPRPHKL